MTYLSIIILGYICNIIINILAFSAHLSYFLYDNNSLITVKPLANSIISKKNFLKLNKIKFYNHENFIWLIPYASILQYTKFYLSNKTIYDRLEDEDKRLQKIIDTNIK